MDETGDQVSLQTITEDLKSLDLTENEIAVNETVEELKDKCESLLNQSNTYITDDSIDVQTFVDNRRINDSEADEESEELIDSQSEDQREDNQSDDTIKDKPIDPQMIKCTIVSTESKEMVSSENANNCLTLHRQPNRSLKPRTEKWGESVGVIDEKGRVRRVLSLDELQNWMILESWGQRTDSKIYCSLINERYPRFFDSTIDYLQRWRMRYNIFVDKVLADKEDPSIVHLGELHVYFDLIPKYSKPYYVNNSFYSNPNESEKELDLESLQKMKNIFDSLRKSQSIFQLKFPIRGYLFHNTNHIYDKFSERQNEMMDESRAVYRKGILRKRPKSRAHSPSMRGPVIRSDRDFGQSSRDFHQTGRQFAGRRNRQLSETSQGPTSQGFTVRDRNKPQLNETQRGFGQNKREFSKNRFSANNNRKAFNSKPNFSEGNRRKTSDDIETEVMFEDTRERHERNGPNGGKPFGKYRKGMNRSDNKVGDHRIDNGFRDKRDFVPKEGNRVYSRSNYSEFRPKNRDVLRSNEFTPFSVSPATANMFANTDMESRRRTNYGQSFNPNFGQPLAHSRNGSFPSMM